MALQTFTWNNGTNANPVVLNSQQLGNLLKIATNNSIQSDVRGHITTSSGQIAKYTKWQLEQKYGENLVIHAEPIEDAFSIFAVRGNINEGEQTEITVTGVSPSSVKFRLQHSFRNVYGIQQSAAQARIHMEGTTLVVDNPQENASWTDVVTVQAILSYEDWNEIDSDSIQTCTVTITAKELTGISLTAPQQVTYGSTFESTIALLPNDNTKRNFVTLDANCTSNGSLVVRKPTVQGTSIYTVAPAEECSLTLIVNAYMFDDLETIMFSSTQSGITSVRPSVVITITTDGTFGDISGMHSSSGPIVTICKVDNNGTPVGEEIQLSGSVVSSSMKYYYYNIAADGSERFKVTFEEAPEGYKNIQNVFITPNQPLTEVAVQYVVNKPDLYFVYGDGDYEPLSAIETRGRVKSGKTRIGIAIVTENTSFILSTASEHKPTSRDYSGYGDRFLRGLNGYSIPVDTATKTQSRIDAVEDFRGQENTLAVYSANIEAFTQGNADGRFFAIPQTTVEINNVQYNGFIPSLGQLEIIAQNASIINNFINTYIGIQNYFNGLPTSTSANQGYVSSTRYNNYNFWLYNPHHSTNPHEQNTPQTNVSLFIITCFPFNI